MRGEKSSRRKADGGKPLLARVSSSDWRGSQETEEITQIHSYSMDFWQKSAEILQVFSVNLQD